MSSFVPPGSLLLSVPQMMDPNFMHTVVLVVDVAFLVIFVGFIAIIAGPLAFVPLLAITGMALLGLYLQRKAGDAARDAQADYGLQQTQLVESIAGLDHQRLAARVVDGVVLRVEVLHHHVAPRQQMRREQ